MQRKRKFSSTDSHLSKRSFTQTLRCLSLPVRADLGTQAFFMWLSGSKIWIRPNISFWTWKGGGWTQQAYCYRHTSVTARLRWRAERAQAGTEVSGWPCERANHLMRSSDRTTTDEWSVTPPPAAGGSAPATSCRPSLWGSRLGSLRTARTNIPAAECGTATQNKHA